MNWTEQERLFNETVIELKRILNLKGREYAGDHDSLGNFKSEDMVRIGLNPLQTWAVYFHKHYKSIQSYIKNGKELSEESVEGRIHDMMNYLFLLKCLIIEEKELQAQIDDAREYHTRND